MIKHLLIIFLFSPLFSLDTSYRFPNNHSLFVHDITSYIKSGDHITIVSPVFDHPELKKKIEKAAQKGKKITFYLNTPHGDPLSMIQYENIHLNLTSIKLHNSMIMIDTQIVCLSDSTIDKEVLDNSKALFHCTEDRNTLYKQLQILKSLSKKGKSYLE